MDGPYLLLWLEAPLQSWGHDSRFGRRESLDFPTKSGVLGLICCAMGAAGEQIEWLRRWADRDMQVIAYTPKDRRGKARQRLPLLEDFQMVGSGYDDLDPWANLLIPKTSEGGKAVGGGTKLTYRYYLQDMAYAVAMYGPREELETLAQSLANPVWDLYLGRKSCVPTELILQGVHADVSQALAKADQLAEEKTKCVAFRVLQGEDEGEVLSLNDVPLQFGQFKKYRNRRVTIQQVE